MQPPDVLVIIRDQTFVIPEIFAWRIDPRHHPGALSPREISDGDDWVTTVWCRPFHLSFSVTGKHDDALRKAVTEYWAAKGDR